MIRGFFFFFFLALLTYLSVTLADAPGQVVINWYGYQIETTAIFLATAVAAVTIVAAIAYRYWVKFCELPGRLRRSRQDARYKKGYVALTRGFASLAAGDAKEARSQAAQAARGLAEPPLALLLSAQAARLAGDKAEAAHFFLQMQEHPETEFIGVRGLLTQATEQHDWKQARLLAERAFRLNPRSAWVAEILMDLQSRQGHWLESREILAQSRKKGAILPAAANRREAIVEYQMGLQANEAGDPYAATKHFNSCLKKAPGFVPGAVHLARLLVEAGKARKARAEVETAWKIQPHPDLFEAFFLARRTKKSSIERARAAQRLAGINPDNAQSHAIAARATLDARLWGETRKHLNKAIELGPTAQVYQLYAQVENAELKDELKARHWLGEASKAQPDPAWVCGACGDAGASWEAFCPRCGAFDSFAWTGPAFVPAQVAAKSVPALPSL